MKSAATLFALAGILAVLHLVLGLAGAADHTNVITAMSDSALGVVYVAVHLATVVCAPILALAGVLMSHRVPR